MARGLPNNATARTSALRSVYSNGYTAHVPVLACISGAKCQFSSLQIELNARPRTCVLTPLWLAQPIGLSATLC